MNLECTNCHEPTIAQKWLVLSTLFPFVFIFLQIRCGRCKHEQQYELDVNVFLDLLLSMIAPILVVLIAMYVAFFTGGANWLMLLVFIGLYLIVRCIKLIMLLFKYRRHSVNQ